MSKMDWKYKFFTEREINENISNCLALRKQKEEVKPYINKLIAEIQK